MNLSVLKFCKKINFLLLLVFFSSPIFVSGQNKPIDAPLYQHPKATIEARVKDLLSRMTIEEKAGQLNQLNGGKFTGPSLYNDGQKMKLKQTKEGKVGSFLNVTGASDTKAIQKVAVEQSRLGVPLLFGFDVIHGFKTVFPIPLAEACSWDIEQANQNASIAAKEAASAGLHWTFAPMCDISNDPRWGRVMEGAGEDPYLGSLLAAARVKGFQGNLDDTFHIMACVKHFAGYGAVEAGREYNQVDFSRVQLWNKYLPPYHAAVNAGAATVMNGFNVFEGVPVSGNKYLVTDILKKKWGFKGFTVSDWNSFGEMIDHGYADDRKDVAYKALKAGSMMDMESKTIIENLPALVKEGKITMAEVDDAVGRILYYKFKLGLFENPYRFSNEEREKKSVFTTANKAVARKSARESIVLLQNKMQLLPLKKDQKSYALIGLFSNSPEDIFDMWEGEGAMDSVVTIYEGLRRRLPNLKYSQGYKADGSSNDSLINAALETASNADIILVDIGTSGKFAGEDKSLADINIPEGQLQLLRALHKTGKPIVVLVTSGRPLILTPIKDLATSMVQCWILGSEEGNAVADVLLGDYNPSAKTVISFPYAIGQIPVYYNHFATGRPKAEKPGSGWFSRYRDIPNEPLYPFGFGLSYTTFSYSRLRISDTVINKNGLINVSINVKNTGKYDGEEVVQLYIQDVAASIVRPVRELKGFKKILLKVGEEKAVVFKLTAKDLTFFDANGNEVLEAGEFKVFVGSSSNETASSSFHLK